MESMILDFCDSLSDAADAQGEQKGMVSKEIETAIRNVIQLNKVSITNPEGAKTAKTRIDRAKEELEKSGLDGLKAVAIRTANLGGRSETRIPYDGQEDERAWIKHTFARVNDGELPTVAISRKIHLYVSEAVLSGSPLSCFQTVVDTEGLDENPIRKDLEEYISRARKGPPWLPKRDLRQNRLPDFLRHHAPNGRWLSRPCRAPISCRRS